MKSTMTTMVVSLTVIAAAMGALLGFVHQITVEPIAQADARAKQEALASVLPADDNITTGEPIEILVPDDNRPVYLYPATCNGQSAGAAIETWTMDGFSGEITVMVGFGPDGVITGYKVLQHAETPGLGAKADEWFREEAEADGNTGASTKNRRSIIGTNGMLYVSKDGGKIDGITAATITSRAFLDAVNRGREAFDMWYFDNNK